MGFRGADPDRLDALGVACARGSQSLQHHRAGIAAILFQVGTGARTVPSLDRCEAWLETSRLELRARAERLRADEQALAVLRGVRAERALDVTGAAVGAAGGTAGAVGAVTPLFPGWLERSPARLEPLVLPERVARRTRSVPLSSSLGQRLQQVKVPHVPLPRAAVWVGRGSGALSAGLVAADQVAEDWSRIDLSGAERVGRVASATVLEGGAAAIGGAGGAVAGAQVGMYVGMFAGPAGVVVGAAVGAAVGGLAGGLAGGWAGGKLRRGANRRIGGEA